MQNRMSNSKNTLHKIPNDSDDKIYKGADTEHYQNGNIECKITKLRDKMREHALDGYLIQNLDEFGCIHYDHRNRLLWMASFSGSYGMLLVTHTEVYLITDPRYTSQAKATFTNKKHKGLKWRVVSVTDKRVAELYSNEILPLRAVGYSSKLHTSRDIQVLQKTLGIQLQSLKSITQDFVNELQIESSTTSADILQTTHTIFVIPHKYHAFAYHKKVEILIRTVVQHFNTIDQHIDYILFTNPASLCWLLNVRGFDVHYTPIVLMYGLLNVTNAHLELFVKSPEIMQNSVLTDISKNTITVHAFNDIYRHFTAIVESGSNTCVDCMQSPAWFTAYKQNYHNILYLPNPIASMQAVKTYAEIRAIKRAHVEDSIAFCKFLAWLEQELSAQHYVTELSAAHQLLRFKQQSHNFLCPSFQTISAFQAHSAMIHYNNTTESDAAISNATPGIYLCDAGSQYRYGTTDVTRTMMIGDLASHHSDITNLKQYYTATLCSHIDLASAIFPIGTTGAQLDALARNSLWQHGADYPHGTGHGVGFLLAVHEGPYGISSGITESLLPGMVISIEPGYYREKQYGIRLENLYLVISSTTYKGFLEFEPLTLIPFDTSLLLRNNMLPRHFQWLTTYNKVMEDTIFPHLNNTVVCTLHKRYTM